MLNGSSRSCSYVMFILPSLVPMMCHNLVQTSLSQTLSSSSYMLGPGQYAWPGPCKGAPFHAHTGVQPSFTCKQKVPHYSTLKLEQRCCADNGLHRLIACTPQLSVCKTVACSCSAMHTIAHFPLNLTGVRVYMANKECSMQMWIRRNFATTRA
jgi:hypothetical protein